MMIIRFQFGTFQLAADDVEFTRNAEPIFAVLSVAVTVF